MTRVKFLIEKEGEGVFAFFPDEDAVHSQHPEYKKMFMSYAHVGQHSACHIEYANECKEAQYNQYHDLLKELIGQGYNDLHVVNSQTLEAHRPPTSYEVKFGEGATHYKDFVIGSVLKKNGDIKKKFKCPVDGLRYYTT